MQKGSGAASSSSEEQPDAEPPIQIQIDTSTFSRYILENCNKAPSGFDSLFVANEPQDQVGPDGSPLGLCMTSADTRVVRSVSVQERSLGILYDRELPSVPFLNNNAVKQGAP